MINLRFTYLAFTSLFSEEYDDIHIASIFFFVYFLMRRYIFLENKIWALIT